jgi:hypothetical protein
VSEFYHSPLPFYLNGSSGTGMSDLDDLLLLTEAHYEAATQRQDVSSGSFSCFVVVPMVLCQSGDGLISFFD